MGHTDCISRHWEKAAHKKIPKAILYSPEADILYVILRILLLPSIGIEK
jgi:hypothetical protein